MNPLPPLSASPQAFADLARDVFANRVPASLQAALVARQRAQREYRVRKDREGFYLAIGATLVARLENAEAANTLRLQIETADDAADVISDVASDCIGDDTYHKARQIERAVNGFDDDYGCPPDCSVCAEEAER